MGYLSFGSFNWALFIFHFSLGTFHQALFIQYFSAGIFHPALFSRHISLGTFQKKLLLIGLFSCASFNKHYSLVNFHQAYFIAHFLVAGLTTASTPCYSTRLQASPPYYYWLLQADTSISWFAHQRARRAEPVVPDIRLAFLPANTASRINRQALPPNQSSSGKSGKQIKFVRSLAPYFTKPVMSTHIQIFKQNDPQILFVFMAFLWSKFIWIFIWSIL